MSTSPAPLALLVGRADGVVVGPVSLSQAFLGHWLDHLRRHPNVKISARSIALSVNEDVSLEHAALVLFARAWEAKTVQPELTASAFARSPLPMDTNMEPRTVALAWQLCSILHLEGPFRLLLSLALLRLTPASIWDYLAACGEFNRPNNPRHSYSWRPRPLMLPMITAFVPWMYFCLRPTALDEYRLLMELIARSEPALIEEALPPLLDGMRDTYVTASARNYQARAMFVVCDRCATGHDPHRQTRHFAIPSISLEGVHGPVRCQMIARPDGVRVLCNRAPRGVQYGLAHRVYDTTTMYSNHERAQIRECRVAPDGVGVQYTLELPANPDARYRGTCYQCGCTGVPVYIVQVFLGLRQELMPAMEPLLRTCQSEVSRTPTVARTRSPAPLSTAPHSPATPIG